MEIPLPPKGLSSGMRVDASVRLRERTQRAILCGVRVPMKCISLATAFLLIFSITAVFASVTISSPPSGATVGNSVHFVASSPSAEAMRIYVDDNSVFASQANSLDTYVNLSLGVHHLVVSSWDPGGALHSTSEFFTVAGGGAGASGITVSSPQPGATVSSPVHVVASATGAIALQIYADDNSVSSSNRDSIDAQINLSQGSHSIVVQSWDSSGRVQKSPMTVNVTASAPPPSGSGISVSSPSAGATVTSPVHFAASAAGAVAMRIYDNNNSVFLTNGAAIDTNVPLAEGSHSIVVQSWDNQGGVRKSSLTLNVSGTTSGGPPAGAGSFVNIDQVTGWANCDVCAGPGGKGPSAPHSTTQFRTSPAIDGSSMEFWLGGTTPYSAALWWRELSPQNQAHHFLYDLYFYLKNPGAAQALEFDVNQAVDGHKFIFGTECNLLGESHSWDVWDNQAQHWMSTGVPCMVPPADTWNHLVLEFERTSDGQAHFVAVTLNGDKRWIDRYTWPREDSGSELNVAFQMDGNARSDNYSVWLDRINLFYW